MSYEADRQAFVSAFGMATAAAVVMPYARPIAVLIGLLVSDPEQMRRAAEEWHDKSFVTSPEYVAAANGPVAPASDDLKGLRADLLRLTNEIGANEGWQGKAYSSYKQKVAEFDTELGKLEQCRLDVGNCLNATASFYHVMATVCFWLGQFLLTIAGLVVLMRFTPSGPAVEGTALRICLSVLRALQTFVDGMKSSAFKATAIFTLIAVSYNQFSQNLVFLAIKGETPNFTSAKAAFDPMQISGKEGGVVTPLEPPDTSDLDTSMMPEISF